MDLIKANGERRQMLARGEPVKGQPGQLRGTLLDVTELKRAEALAAELETARQKLIKTDSLARLSGAVAHHFNNAMMGVLGNLEMTRQPNSGIVPGTELATMLQDAWTSAQKAAQMSAMMLTYLGQTQLTTAPADLTFIARSVFSKFKSRHEGKATFEAELPKDEVPVQVDIEKMNRVLESLLANAVESKCRERHVIRLALHVCAAADIALHNRFPIDFIALDTSYACIAVSDSGCGISPRVMSQVFDPFYTTKEIGRGVDLPMALGIIRGHHGVITIESAEQQGSTFRIYLPVSGAGGLK